MDAPLIGRTLGHFRVTDAIGAGGMGVVYKATDLRLKRTVALKVLPPELALDPERRARLLAEARAASALNHPNIVTVHEIDSADGTDFIAMEYVEGRSLDRLIGADGPPAGRGARLRRPDRRRPRGRARPGRRPPRPQARAT